MPIPIEDQLIEDQLNQILGYHFIYILNLYQ